MTRGPVLLVALFLAALASGCGSRATQPNSLQQAFDGQPEYSQPEVRRWQMQAIKKYAAARGLEEDDASDGQSDAAADE